MAGIFLLLYFKDTAQFFTSLHVTTFWMVVHHHFYLCLSTCNLFFFAFFQDFLSTLFEYVYFILMCMYVCFNSCSWLLALLESVIVSLFLEKKILEYYLISISSVLSFLSYFLGYNYTYVTLTYSFVFKKEKLRLIIHMTLMGTAVLAHKRIVSI